MNEFLKTLAGIILVLFLALMLDKQSKDISALLVLFSCAGVLILTMKYVQPVLDFFGKLQVLGNVDVQSLNILLKAVGIGLLSEIVGLFCADVGRASLGKTVQIFSSVLILWIVLPLLTKLLELIENILGYI